MRIPSPHPLRGQTEERSTLQASDRLIHGQVQTFESVEEFERDTLGVQPGVPPATDIAAPIGARVSEAGPVCRCGAKPHQVQPNRCARGHGMSGNGLALVTGERSAVFWSAAEGLRSEIREAAIADAGHSHEDAPRTLLVAADGLAQAVLMRDAAYLRAVEQGGPMSSDSRARRAWAVWESAAAIVERHVKTLGLKRTGRQLPKTPMDAIAALPELE